MKRFSLFLLGIIVLLPISASAHVRYFSQEYSGIDFSYLFSPLFHIPNLLLMLGTIIITIIISVIVYKSSRIMTSMHSIAERAHSYHDLLGWMLRLPLGIALLGFGTSHTLLTPILPVSQFISSFSIILGFMLLVGFVPSIAAMGVVLLWLFTLTQNTFLIGSLDILALAFSIIILDTRRPGISDLLQIPEILFPSLKQYIHTILRVGLGTGMLFLAFDEKLLNPHMAAHVVSLTGLMNVIPVSSAMWVLSAGVIEALVGLLLIIGWKPRIVSTIAFMVLSLSFFYFKEDVTSHVTLFGTLACIFVTAPLPLKKYE